MSKSVGGRVTLFWTETVAAALAGALGLLTLVWRDWLEAFGLDPDHHDGSAEWLIVGVLLVLALALALHARTRWHRLQRA